MHPRRHLRLEDQGTSAGITQGKESQRPCVNPGKPRKDDVGTKEATVSISKPMDAPRGVAGRRRVSGVCASHPLP